VTVSAAAQPIAGLTRLPVNPDEGFPQSFLLALAGRTYQVQLYVDVPEHLLPHELGQRETVDVVSGGYPAPGPLGEGAAADPAAPAPGLLVAAVARQEPDGTLVPLLRRRLLPGLLYTARELLLLVDEVRIAAGNLNGAGPFGSVLRARVGVR
jgi:hypothetical protein